MRQVPTMWICLSYEWLCSLLLQRHNFTTMSFAEERFLPSGTYVIINAEYSRSIAYSEVDQCLSTTSDNYEVSSSFIWLCWGLVVTALRLSSGPSYSSRTRNGPFKVLQMSLWILHHRQRREKTSFQWRIHQSHTNGWSSVIWGQLIPTCRFLSCSLASK